MPKLYALVYTIDMTVQLTTDQITDFETVYNYLRVEDRLPIRAGAIIVGGSGSRTDMADRAAELYHQGISKQIVFSGFAHPDFGMNESELLAERAIELGVAILVHH